MVFFTVLSLTLLTFAALIVFCHWMQHPLPSARRVLFITAHPDDETMFFAPTLRGLAQAGTEVYLLCLTTGDNEGLGWKRKRELMKAVSILGAKEENVTILDYDIFQDGLVLWNEELLGKVILRFIQTLEVDMVVTFDEGGVSSHPNHIACFTSVQYLYTRALVPADIQIFVLESVPIWRKYLTGLDALISSLHSTFLYVSPLYCYLSTWRAMSAHASQLLWFRYLYMLFSRYVLINTLKRIHISHRFHMITKKIY
ncbi:hypothetical protein AB6A40_009358 [Gnathostoma spinigerum]|uniref:N-acetylglucosaminylphosphatidylinositol deacetylase n=1 Tax=Gnathostoma spinigerum TaxID=75299 RepID=A0ABD6ERR7_9BILA